MKEVCLDVEEEPLLQEITGEIFKAKTTKTEKDSRLDLSARGFWLRGQKVFCDVRVFNPLTKCHRTKPITKVHELNEKEKKVKYAARINEVEHGSFTPLVFSLKSVRVLILYDHSLTAVTISMSEPDPSVNCCPSDTLSTNVDPLIY